MYLKSDTIQIRADPKWSHLEKITKKIVPYRSDVEVGLLIGTSCIRAIKPLEIITGNDDDPNAKRTFCDGELLVSSNLKPSDNEDIDDSQADSL